MHDEDPKVDQDESEKEPDEGMIHPRSFALRVNSFFVALPAEGHPLPKFLPNEPEVDRESIRDRLAFSFLRPGYKPPIYKQFHSAHLECRYYWACRDRFNSFKGAVFGSIKKRETSVDWVPG